MVPVCVALSIRAFGSSGKGLRDVCGGLGSCSGGIRSAGWSGKSSSRVNGSSSNAAKRGSAGIAILDRRRYLLWLKVLCLLRKVISMLMSTDMEGVERGMALGP